MKRSNPMSYSDAVNPIWVDMASLRSVHQAESAWLFSQGLEVSEFLGLTFSGADLWEPIETRAHLWREGWTGHWMERCGRRKAAGECWR